MRRAIKIPDAKAAVHKGWEKLEKLPAWQLNKVKSKKEVILVLYSLNKVRLRLK